MSKIDYQELREAAEQATQDEWVAYILPGHNGFILRARLRVGIADTLLTGLALMGKGMLVLMPVISRLSHQKLRWHSWAKLSAWRTQILMLCAE